MARSRPIRQEPASAPASLWEILVQRKLIDDEQILKAIAAPLPVRRSRT